MYYPRSGVINTHLFVKNGIDTFLGNRSFYKAVMSCQIKNVLILFQFFPKKLDQKLSKGGTEFMQEYILGRGLVRVWLGGEDTRWVILSSTLSPQDTMYPVFVANLLKAPKSYPQHSR